MIDEELLPFDRKHATVTRIDHPMGKLKNAIRNALKLKARVYRIFECGQLPLSNNAVEQTIRPATLIRKNYLFAKSVAGTKANAIYYTLVATAQMNHLNVYCYFEYLFEHFPNRKTTSLAGFLSWSKTVQLECHE